MTDKVSHQTPSGTEADPFDLLVVGGGINGVGVARDAVGRGLSVLLCEKGDLSEGTSSRSGKYIHGGLRYLEYYEFRLVREALIEREVVLDVAPHLAKPLRLILVHSPEQRPRWLIRLGLFLYDHLGGRKRIPASRAVNLQSEWPDGLIKSEFQSGFAYWDVWIDDARLVVLNAVDAARRGAEILTRTELSGARRKGELWCATLRDVETGDWREVHARAIFNGAGPWVEKVLSSVDKVNSGSSVRLVKGSHIILPKWWTGDNGFVLQAPDKRIIFVNPYFEGLALVGTTDVPFDGRPEDVKIDQGEIDYLLGILNTYFTRHLSGSDILHSYSGVRPLFNDDDDKSASAVTRDYTFELDTGSKGGKGKSQEDKSTWEGAPLLSAFGGKLTTYRKLAEHALDHLVPFFPKMKPAWTASASLPGGDFSGRASSEWAVSFRQSNPWLPEGLAEHYVLCYGTDAAKLLAGASCPADLGAHFGGLFYEVEARWLLDHEWARTADDMLVRRTKHGLFLTDDEKASVETWLTGIRGAA
ncbi:glycerol-3-phosphate dehydrogenase [uncultured Roseibium sp.]|uniref:glycerol-3-phosphate dehydrogenase n=1 Tax=uncultured Roseibium sp. TaxID=1936171 RepID=UPI00261FFE42|nr:glycerol-3-phosphate dehydrogenase [uncultured Roseibium sp.]